MIEALTLRDLYTRIDNRYEYDEQKIIGLMLARYGIRTTKEIINQNYEYWNTTSGKGFDLFWAGYGAYLPFSQESSTKTILDYPENCNRIYFDLEAFVNITQVTDAYLKNLIGITCNWF